MLAPGPCNGSTTEADWPDIAPVPLNALVALHLLSRDILAMTRGASIKTRDTGMEYTSSLDLPPGLKDDLDRLREGCPEVLPILAVVCRLVARTIYLTTDLPLETPDLVNPQEAPRLCMLVKEMEVLDELSEACVGKGEEAQEFLEMPVPYDLEYWNDWNNGHVIAASKFYRSLWSQIRTPYLAPPKSQLAASSDAAVAGGMAKGLASSGWAAPKTPGHGRRKAKRGWKAQKKEPGRV